MASAPAPVRRRALATSLWLAVAVLLGGLDLPAHGYDAFRFAPFGIVAGLLGILYVFTLTARDVIRLPAGWPGAMLAVYWVAATAMMFRVLLPPPGLVQAGLAIGAAAGAGVIVTRDRRVNAATWLGGVAIALAVLRFALVPAFEVRSSLPDRGVLQLGGAIDALRGVFVEYDPQRPAVQALHLGAVACWVVALWTQWSRSSVGPGGLDGPPSPADG